MDLETARNNQKNNFNFFAFQQEILSSQGETATPWYEQTGLVILLTTLFVSNFLFL